MADIGEMRVKIGADITEILSKVDAAKAKLNQLVESNQELKTKIKELNGALSANQKELNQADRALQKLIKSGEGGSAAAKELRTQIRGISSSTTELKAELNTTQRSLAANTVQIKAQTVAVKQAEAAGSGFSKGLNTVWGGLRKIAYIVPGLGIAGLISLISGPVIDAFNDWINAVDELNAKQKLFKEINEDAAKGASEQVTSLEVLRTKLTDLTKPQSTRIQLAKEYNKIADEGNRINLAEINNLSEINKQIDKQIGLIERQSLAKAAQSKISSYADKAIEAELKFQDALRQSGLTEEQVSKSIEARSKQIDATIKKTQQSLDGFNPNKNVILKPLVPDTKDAIASVQLVDKKLEALLLSKRNSSIELNKIIKTLLPDISDDSFFTKDKAGDKAKETAKHIETVDDVINKMNAHIDVLNKKEIILKTSQAQEKVKVIEKTIDELLTKFKLLTSDPHIVELQAKIADINLTQEFKDILHFDKGAKIDVPVEFQPKTDTAKLTTSFDAELDNMIRYLKKMGVNKTDKVDLGFGVLMSENIETASKEKVKATFGRILTDAEQFSQDFKNIMSSTVNDSLSGFGEAIGNAIGSGGDVGEAIFGSFFDILANGIEQLGKALIVLGTAKVAAEKFFAAPGIGTVIAGVATVAFGALLKASIPKFAEGGLISGPGSPKSDSVLARVSRGEFIMQADAVSKFGVGFFEKLNKGLMPTFDSFGLAKFAVGGSITPSIIRTSQVPSFSGGSIGGGQLLEIKGNFELRNDRLVAAVSRGNAQIRRNS